MGQANGRTKPVAVGPRALGAMAEAVRRAREASTSTRPGFSSDTVPPPRTPEVGPYGSSRRPSIEQEPSIICEGSFASGTVGPNLRIGRPSGQVATHRSRREVRLMASVKVLGVMVLVATTALLVSLNTRPGSSSSRSPAVGARTSTRGPAVPRTPSSPLMTIPPAMTLPAAIAPNSATGGGVPVLSSLVPSSGTAGQVVVISGVNLFSADGQVLARFDRQAAPTKCPVQTSCTVVVPVITGSSPAVAVTITTSAGTSNTLTFVYG